MGTTMVAEAVFEVVSEMIMAISAETAETAARLVKPKVSAMPVPMTSARPVSERSVPSAMPQPKRMTVPQSMRAASFQFIVKRRSAQLTGRMKRSTAAIIATVPSSSLLPTRL
jgi:hypothetical protein